MYINLANIDFNPGQGGGGGVKPSGTLEISENGVYNVYSYASASVDVHPSISLSETYTSNGDYNITGEFNGGVITVDVLAPQFVTETLNVSANGTYNPRQGIDGYSQVVVDVPISGWDQKSFTEGTVEIINLDNSASFVVSNAFSNNQNIQTVNLPYATTVGDYAFYRCYSLSQANLPVCSYIGSYAFQECSSLSSINLPMCNYISDNVFTGCKSLSSVNLPVCSYIGNRVFISCSSLSSVNLPMCNYIGRSALKDCSSLSSINLPMCKNVGYNVFWNCYSLSSINLPVCEIIDEWAFENCSNLNYVYVGSEISTVCVLRASNAFSGCSALTSIYVPTSLVESYKTATNWTYYSNKIVGI